jgi:hypothetical protein
MPVESALVSVTINLANPLIGILLGVLLITGTMGAFSSGRITRAARTPMRGKTSPK